jgi:hypothetical protein
MLLAGFVEELASVNTPPDWGGPAAEPDRRASEVGGGVGTAAQELTRKSPSGLLHRLSTTHQTDRLGWLRGLDLNRRPLGYEPIAGLHALQRATARRRENAQLAPSTLAPAGRRWWQFSGRNPVADARLRVLRVQARRQHARPRLAPVQSAGRSAGPHDLRALRGRSWRRGSRRT